MVGDGPAVAKRAETRRTGGPGPTRIWAPSPGGTWARVGLWMRWETEVDGGGWRLKAPRLRLLGFRPQGTPVVVQMIAAGGRAEQAGVKPGRAWQNHPSYPKCVRPTSHRTGK